WIQAARRLGSGSAPLPAPRVEGALPRGRRLRLALLAAGVVFLLGVAVAWYFLEQSGVLAMGRYADSERIAVNERHRLAALDQTFPAPASITIDDAGIARYLAVRRAIAPALGAIPTADQILGAEGLGGSLRGIETRSEKRAAFTGGLHQALQSA